MRNLYFGISIAPYRLDLCHWLYRNYSCDIYHRAESCSDLAFNQNLVRSECGFPLLYYPAVGRNRSRFRTLRKVIRESDPETVFVFEFSLLTLQVVLIRFFRKKKFRIISFCDDSIDMISGNDFSRLHRIARHFVPHWVDNLILDNREARDWYRDRFGKGVYFPIIADEDRWRKDLQLALPRSEELYREYIGDRKPVVLFVGRLVAVKNVPLLLEAFRSCREQAHLVIVGDGVEEGHLHELDRKYGTQAIFTGKQHGCDLHAWYNLADMFVLPSSMEPFGAVTNEALMSGLYALVSRKAGSATLIVPGENGDVFSPDSAPSLAQLMEKYIGLVGEKKLPLTVKPNRMPCLFEDTLRKALGELDAR